MEQKIIAIYSRSDIHGADQSIEEQVTMCKDAVSQMYGTDIQFQVYADRGVGGQALIKPGLHSMLQDANAGLVHVVAVTRLNRIDRYRQNAISTIFTLLRHQIDVVTVMEGHVFQRDDLRTLVTLNFWEHESKQHGLRIKHALKRRRSIRAASN
jgi:DNA invertase Pin-like site-specific DNA recombinase